MQSTGAASLVFAFPVRTGVVPRVEVADPRVGRLTGAIVGPGCKAEGSLGIVIDTNGRVRLLCDAEHHDLDYR